MALFISPDITHHDEIVFGTVHYPISFSTSFLCVNQCDTGPNVAVGTTNENLSTLSIPNARLIIIGY